MVRRLTADELEDLAAALGAEPTGDVASLVATTGSGDDVVGVTAELLVAIIGRRAFTRRNEAVAIAAADLMARLNGWTLDLEPPEAVMDLVARVRRGLSAGEARAWLLERMALEPPIVGPRCPSCSMPLREALSADTYADPSATVVLVTCGGCGSVLAPPFLSEMEH